MVLLVMLFISSCSNMRYLPKEESLYTGAKLKFDKTEKIANEKIVRKEAEAVIKPKPNKKFLRMRVKLWLYNIAGTPKGKGLRYWLRNKVGEPPVLLREVQPEITAGLIDAKLYNNGIFRGSTSYEVSTKKGKSKIIYTSFVHAPYTIAKIEYPPTDNDIGVIVQSTIEKTLVKKGDIYKLDQLLKERSRLDAALKEEGYFYFNPDYFSFEADTNNGNGTLNLKLAIKNEAPYEALLKYRINQVMVIPDYSLRNDSLKLKRDTIAFDSTLFIYADRSIRPKAITRNIFLKPGDIYSRTHHNMTLNRLMGMGAFKFVSVKFSEIDTLNPGNFDAMVLLTALPRKSLRTEFEIISKSNNYTGPTLNISYRNRNALNGAELLVLNAHGSFETQISGQEKGAFSYEVGPQIDFYVPRFFVPYKIKNPTGYYLPKTRFTLAYDFYHRAKYYDLRSLKFIYGYKWKENLLKEHELNPVNINYTRLANKTAAFEELLNNNILLRKSFEEQFIAGITYNFTYNEQVLPEKKNQFYFNGNAELSGNTISFFKKTFASENPTQENPSKVAGAVYSQFARAAIDVRNYYKLNEQQKFAMRFYAGVGKAYGNSSTLPLIKQFFSGGSNSVRAFRVRSLGPGTYRIPDSLSSQLYIDQGGDIKLEANIEYRFPIVSIIKGALFADAGNIWLMKENENLPGGKFYFNQFLSQVAMGTGFGLRADANFFVLRFDLAAPLRKPWLSENDRWTLSSYKPFSSQWRGENLILNIAIGYPF